MNISKHALNRLIEFIVLGSFHLKIHRHGESERFQQQGAEYHSVRAFALSHRSASSVRVCMSRLVSKRHSIQLSYLQQRLSISHLDARTGFLEGLSNLQHVRTVMMLTYSFRNFSTKWDMTEMEGDWKDAILEQKALVNRLYVPRRVRCCSMLCTCIHRTQICGINYHFNLPPLFSRIAPTSNDAYPHV